MDWLEEAISRQRHSIESFLAGPLGELASICSYRWEERSSLDAGLTDYLKRNPQHRCRQLYAIDRNGMLHSSTISDAGHDGSIVGRDLSGRPYLEPVGNLQQQCVYLSDVYIDRKSRKPCITALHCIMIDNRLAGFIAADFGLRDLPLKRVDGAQLPEWRQIKGDPAIRSTLFQQTRTRSAMDERLDEVLDVIDSLMTEQGIFHSKLHFSSSRATLWSYRDPYRYRLHVLDEIINPKVCLFYTRMNYPDETATPAATVSKVLRVFKSLREADDTIYLRAGSLNIMNGQVGLNFSCDGTHYMSTNEFLNKDLEFWFGEARQKMPCVT